MKPENLITTDPNILNETPVFTGTRVPVETLFDHLESGISISEFLDSFPTVSKDQVIALLEETSGDIDEERKASIKKYLLTATSEEVEYLKRNGITKQEATVYEAQIEKIKNGTFDPSEYEDWEDVKKELHGLI